MSESQIESLRAEFERDLAGATTVAALKAVRDRYLARKGGLVSGLLKALGSAPPAERPRLGKLANDLKQQFEAQLEERIAAAEASRPPVGAVDVTLPGRVPSLGHRHPLTILRDRIESIFMRMGFLVIEGPELEDDYHNFEALNMPPEHPARDMQDTLYLAAPVKSAVGTPATLLRTHTSGMQIRYMEKHQPPVRLIAPGRVYRRDNLDLTHTPMFQQCEGLVVGEGVSLADLKGTFEALNMPANHPARDMQDTFYLQTPLAGGLALLRTHTSAMQIRHMEKHAPPVRLVAIGPVYRKDNLDLTHTPMFHQVEGLVVGEGISLADLKGTLFAFLHELFGQERDLRFRPSFFPYTEPSAEVDISCAACHGAGCPMCKRTGWLEILGSGMVHPAVFEAVGYDPERYTGFAFGMGIERVALLKWGVEDIRLFYENDLRFLEQFPL